MKIGITIIVIISISMFSISSCESGDNTFPDANHHDIHLLENGVVEYNPNFRIDGILHFENSEELQSALDYLSNLSFTERKIWEEKNNFRSIRRHIEEIYEKIELAKSLEELLEVVSQNSNYIEIQDSSIVTLLEFDESQYISNLDGLYTTSNFVNRVSNQSYEAYNIDEYLIEGSLLGLCPINSIERTKQMTAKKGSGIYYCEESYTRNESGCSNDRRVFISTYFHIVYATFTIQETPPCTYTEAAPRLRLRVWGQKKVFCIWADYRTIYAYKGVSCDFYALENSENKPFWYPMPTCEDIVATNSSVYEDGVTDGYHETDTDDYYAIYSYYYPGVRTVNEYGVHDDCDVYSIDAKGTSRGVGFVWAVIDEYEE